MTFGAVANAELQPEIDADTDEQDKKRDGYNVQRAHQEEAERRRNRQTNDEAEGYCQDNPRRMERQPEDYEDSENR